LLPQESQKISRGAVLYRAGESSDPLMPVLSRHVHPAAMWIGSAAVGVLFVRWCGAAVRVRDLFGVDTSRPSSIVGMWSGTWSLPHWLAGIGAETLLAVLCRALHHGLLPTTWWLSPNAMATEHRWTPLHIAAASGSTCSCRTLVVNGASVNSRTTAGHSALAIAVSHGDLDTVRALLDFGADPSSQDHKRASPLHIAVVRGDPCLVDVLLEKKASPDVTDSGGYTALLRACMKQERWGAAERMLKARADVGMAAYGQGLTALLLVAAWTDDEASARAAESLMAALADPAAVDTFGTTALHLACREARPTLVATLCKMGAPTAAQDNDGHYPLQALCTSIAKQPDNASLVVAMTALLQADPMAAQRLDFADASALQTLLLISGLERSAPAPAVQALIAAEADPTQEDESGFTAVHYAAKAGKTEQDRRVLHDILQASPKVSKAFLDAVDFQKTRNTSNTKYLARRGGQHRIPLETRQGVLDGDLTLAGIARLISSGRCRKVIALMGAGASTSAGIPDFRSSSGLWAQAATRELFSYQGFMTDPEAFWRKTAELFVDRTPTKVHSMLARLAQQGILHRIYTQNIDGLEEAANIPADRVVACHGTTSRVVCASNRLHSTHGRSVADVTTAVIAGEAAPRCKECGALLRPDVVFFGEPLPPEFDRLHGEDITQCDLLIVIGTALNVYPVAGLVNRVSMLTPRLLINREAVGPWTSCRDNVENYRDVFYEGECDAGAEELGRALGWMDG